MAPIIDSARTCQDPLPILYDKEIILSRSREWDDYTNQIVKKETNFRFLQIIEHQPYHWYLLARLTTYGFTNSNIQIKPTSTLE